MAIEIHDPHIGEARNLASLAVALHGEPGIQTGLATLTRLEPGHEGTYDSGTEP